jgi:hypothetical protein
MGLYNFEKRFVPFILSGAKRHTIRGIRKHPDKPGKTMHLYTGLRQKGAKLLMRVPCVKVEEITIEMQLYRGGGTLAKGLMFPHILIDGIYLTADEKEALARRDGFSSFHEMMKFWDGRLPFHGHIIHWKFDAKR